MWRDKSRSDFLCSQEEQTAAENWTKHSVYRRVLGGGGVELSRVEISGVRTGGVSSPELRNSGVGGVLCSGIGVGNTGIGRFSYSGIGGFCSDFSSKVSIIWEGSH